MTNTAATNLVLVYRVCRPRVRVQDHSDCASRVHVKDLDGFIGATAQNYIWIICQRNNKRQLLVKSIVLNNLMREQKDTRMKSVDGGETGYLLCSFLMKDFYQFVLVVRLISAHTQKKHVIIVTRGARLY